MKNDTKSVIILVAIFILGILLGVIADRTFIEYNFRSRLTRDGGHRIFKDRLLHEIDPNDDQLAEIEKVLDKYAPRFIEMRMTARQQVISLVDSVNQQLKPILTEEQYTKLLNRTKPNPFFRPDFKNRGPIHFDPPEHGEDFPDHEFPPPPDLK